MIECGRWGCDLALLRLSKIRVVILFPAHLVGFAQVPVRAMSHDQVRRTHVILQSHSRHNACKHGPLPLNRLGFPHIFLK